MYCGTLSDLKLNRKEGWREISTLLFFAKIRGELPEKGSSPYTGLVGFEPTNPGVKVLCLTPWR